MDSPAVLEGAMDEWSHNLFSQSPFTFESSPLQPCLASARVCMMTRLLDAGHHAATTTPTQSRHTHMRLIDVQSRQVLCLTSHGKLQ